MRRWWIDTRPHTMPRAQGQSNRFTAWSKKPDYGRIHESLADAARGRLVEVMTVQEHERVVTELLEEIKKLTDAATEPKE